jgi:hypothetical protein
LRCFIIMTKRYVHLIILSVLLSGCAYPQPVEDNYGYHLNQPDAVFILPDSLKEISGLTPVSPDEFACIQDENGILFIYNIRENKITHQYPFNINGDYEGIARVGKSIYILRSDGTLFEISNYNSAGFKLYTYVTGIMTGDNEGLCYDKAGNRLLIGSKSRIGKGSHYKDIRVIYGFDLTSKELSEKPVFDFNIKAVESFAGNGGIQLPVKTTGKGKTRQVVKFRTSEIDLHPVTHQLFVLSAADYMLFVFDKDGIIRHIERLDPHLFNKAEGMSFLDNGDLLISNEGENQKPTILKFNYRF